MAAKVLAGAAAGAAGLGGYEIYRLNKDYPLLPPKPYINSPTIQAAQPAHPGQADYIYATIKLPPGHKGMDDKEALDKHINYFFQDPFLRAETAIFSSIGYKSPRPTPGEMLNAVAAGQQPKDVFMAGFFNVVHREPAAMLVWYTIPGPKGAKHEELPAGTQVLGAHTEPGSNNVEVAYSCTSVGPPAPQEGPAMLWVHRMYMRYLLDSAKRKFERDVKAGRA